MKSVSKWSLTDAEKSKYIAQLTANLSALRTQAGISQKELANLIGVSRQTYSAIERKSRQMSWSTYLSLVLFFDQNNNTHKMFRLLSIFPQELITRFNNGEADMGSEVNALLGDQSQDIISHLDQQALQSIRSIIMVEYARCTQLPSEAIIKSFGGLTFPYSAASTKDTDAAKAIKSIKKGSDSGAK